MNRLYILLFLLLPIAGQAQPDGGSLRIDNLVMERLDGRLSIAFEAQADPASVPNGYTLVFTPILQDGSNRQALPSLYIQTRRAEKQAARNDFAFPEGARRIMDSDPSVYRETVSYENWMRGAEFSLENTAFYCRAYADGDVTLFASDLFAGDTTVIIRVLEAPVIEKAPTTGEMLAEHLSFVAPLADFERARDNIAFDENMPLAQGRGIGSENNNLVEEFIDRNRAGSLIIYYELDSRTINTAYRHNARSLSQITEAVQSIEASGDSRVSRVVIAGFASPEGSVSHNERLAWDRAQAIKNWLLEHTPVPEEKVRVYNGAEDWRGLRLLVEGSDLEGKEQALEIIDRILPTDDSTGRLAQLKRLNGGQTYRYLFEHFFPELRNAAYIKVYFENTEDTE